MRLGLNCSTVDPLARSELEAFQARTVERLRFNLPHSVGLMERFLVPYAGLTIQPQILFHRVDSMAIATPTIRLALDLFGPDGFDLEGVNEWRMAHDPAVTLQQTLDAFHELYDLARGMGHTGAILAPSVMNLDASRDIPDLRTIAASIPSDAILNVHRYARGVLYAGQDLRRPWPPAQSRAQEFDILRSIADGRPIAFTETGVHRAPERVFLGLQTVRKMPEDVYRDLVAELRLLDRFDIERACVYAWMSGSDPNHFQDQWGLADVTGQPLASAAALTDWRT